MPHRNAPSLVLVTIAVALAASMTSGFLAHAQGSLLPITPDPAQCTVTLTPDQLRAMLAATPAAIAETPDASAATPGAFTLPEGIAADEVTVAAVTQTAIKLLACINGRNTLGFYSVISPAAVQEELLQQGLTESDLDAAFTRTPTPASRDAWATLIALREVRILPDRRVAALVDSLFPDDQSTVQTDLFYFVQLDGRWYVDDIVEDLEDLFPPATPTP